MWMMTTEESSEIIQWDAVRAALNAKFEAQRQNC